MTKKICVRCLSFTCHFSRPNPDPFHTDGLTDRSSLNNSFLSLFFKSSRPPSVMPEALANSRRWISFCIVPSLYRERKVLGCDFGKAMNRIMEGNSCRNGYAFGWALVLDFVCEWFFKCYTLLWFGRVYHVRMEKTCKLWKASTRRSEIESAGMIYQRQRQIGMEFDGFFVSSLYNSRERRNSFIFLTRFEQLKLTDGICTIRLNFSFFT